MFSVPRRVLPGLNIEVSAIGAGCWAIGGHAINRGVPIGWDDVDPAAAYEGLLRAHALGVTLFDTADVYGLGQSERLLGWLLRRVDRASVVVSSKVGYFAGTARHPYLPAQMHRQFATTLDNLATDYLDIYFLHSSDFGPDDRHLDGAVAVMRELREQGLIRAIGLRAPHSFAEQWATSDRPEAAATARWLCLFDAIQPDIVTARYNLLSPTYQPWETDIFDFARPRGVGVLIKQPLGQGALFRRHAGPHQSFSSGDHRSRDPLFRPTALAEVDARLAPIRARFGDTPAAMARVALGYTLHRDSDAVALVGFRDATQIHTTVTSLADPLTLQDMTELKALLHASHATV
ncbi:aldo/keto reductase [Pseudonocardia acaciae]|uniref:aldo/keto reductase n=1 Tax=Pseudonocardia acaciae TaxID=551276 RepID=UPI000AA46405|nr:aldo/keto reductase [Pseudonocardia acaciae]